MHRLLERQIHKAETRAEGPERWSQLLALVDATYDEQDRERRLANRTLELMSEELLALNRRNLEQSSARFKVLFDHVVDGILTFNELGMIESANPSAMRIFGWNSDIVGACLASWIPELRAPLGKDGIADGPIREYQARHADGRGFTIELSCSKVFQEDRPLYIVFLRDVSERKAQQTRLQLALNRAEAASTAKSEFLANISHEFRTPLNTILGFAQLLEDRLDSLSDREYLDAISASGRSLLALINDVLDLSKIEAGALELQLRPINLVELFGEVGRVYQYLAERKKVDFQILVDPRLPSHLLLDEARIRQVLVNLVGNATKFTLEGFIRISVRGQRSADTNRITCEFEVEDTGIGIAPEAQESIFEAFVQQPGQDHALFHGTGLGLAITRRLVTMMGGTLSLKRSTPGKGSVFLVQLPEVLIVQAPNSGRNASEAPSSLQKLKEVGAGRRVLLAEDVVMNQVLISKFLEPAGIEVLVAENGREALTLAEQKMPHLIFMDMRMPVMDGYQATSLLCQKDWARSIPIVAMTANAMMEDRQRALDAGCCDVLSKPVTREALYQMLLLHWSEPAPPAPEKAAVPNTGPAGVDLVHRPLAEWLGELRQTMIFSEIEAFAQELERQGKTGGRQEWVGLAQELAQHAHAFEIVPLQDRLASLESLLL